MQVAWCVSTLKLISGATEAKKRKEARLWGGCAPTQWACTKLIITLCIALRLGYAPQPPQRSSRPPPPRHTLVCETTKNRGSYYPGQTLGPHWLCSIIFSLLTGSSEDVRGHFCNGGVKVETTTADWSLRRRLIHVAKSWNLHSVAIV